MPVRINLDAYPYQEYGALEGVVKEYHLARGQERYMVLAIEISEMPERMELLPGMAASVDIITGRTNMLRLLF